MSEFLASSIGLLLLGFLTAIVWLPAWWLAGRIDSDRYAWLVRLPFSAGLALAGYITCVNLLGKLFDHSLYAVAVTVGLNLLACIFLLYKKPEELGMAHLWVRRRWLITWFLIALVLSLPQWYQAVSTPYWDEVASSAIHLTAPNQFAEGVFPPRHNAFPDISIKYHYGFTILSGTAHWVTGLSSNVSIDMVSTVLWLFTFLFTISWLLQIGVTRIAAAWGGFAVLLGGGLSWLYLPWLQVYDGFQKSPAPSLLVHSYDTESGWLGNLMAVMRNFSIHMTNADGDVFHLPFDIAITYQQHAVALGLALTMVAAYVFWLWQSRKGFAPQLLILGILCFGLVFLGHAVFGAIASISAGLVLLLLWLRQPSKMRFAQGALFTLGVTLIAFAHGGMMSQGPEYGPGAILKFRDAFGYISGGVLDQIHWLLAGFGLPLLLAMVSLWVWYRGRKDFSSQRTLLLVFFVIFGVVSFLIPQLFYFSSGLGIEEETQISKFFFCTQLAIAVVSVIAIDWFDTRLRRRTFLPLFAATATMTAMTPLAINIAAADDEAGRWVGFYKSPYDWHGGRDHMAVGKALRNLKKGNRDVYCDFSMKEQTKGFLSELLIYGGSIFSLSPTRYEVTGSGFLISERRVKDKIRLESKIARLLPGAPEETGTDWIFMPSPHDPITRPTIVRSRLAKMIAEDTLSKRFQSGPRALYEFQKPTYELDRGIERYWTPKVIAQAHADWDGDGSTDLVFFDYPENRVLIEEEHIALPDTMGQSVKNEFPLLFLAKLPGDNRVDVLMGRMSDGFYRRGKTVSQMVRQYPFHWQRRDSIRNDWLPNHQYLFWRSPVDIPLVADHDNDGYDSHLGYRPGTGQWFIHPGNEMDGPTLPVTKHPLPVVGRFLPGSEGDLAVWSPVTGEFIVKSIQDEKSASIHWGGRPGDILLPGDYDGDGHDEIGIWQPHTQTWWVKALPTGPNRQYRLGTSSSIPMPHDYNDDGRLDLAYWEPGERKIHVSFDFGQSIGRTIEVPPHAIPIFVHMY